MCLKLNKTTIVPVFLKLTWKTDAKFTIPINLSAMARTAQVALPVPQRKGPNLPHWESGIGQGMSMFKYPVLIADIQYMLTCTFTHSHTH